jgi:uncharacterized protein (DUF58 family)
VLDLSPSMAFGTARRLKADVADGVALVFGRLGVRRAGSVGLIGFGAGASGARESGARESGARESGASAGSVLAPRGSKPALVALRALLDAASRQMATTIPMIWRLRDRFEQLESERRQGSPLSCTGAHLGVAAVIGV